MNTLGPHSKGICEDRQTPMAVCNLCQKSSKVRFKLTPKLQDIRKLSAHFSTITFLVPFDLVISICLSCVFKNLYFPMRNSKEEFDLQLQQVWALAVSGAQYRAFSQQMHAETNQHKFVTHMLGICLGCQSDFQASQALYYNVCG